MKALAALFLALFAGTALAQDQSFVIGEIEFYGYSHLQLDRIKAALPLHEGVVLAVQDFPSTKVKIMASVKREVGREQYVGIPATGYHRTARLGQAVG